ncbi:MAG: hypothetical protein OZSIB_2046 [Candidatus Ozemobacter sibiricus]|jgi:hypothetical protein|uniref:Uncharacterized protein n=1 Tax=Candidatus Ozemobacter sibiricus TaxID=2268124 RepID=A0A367ZJ61_9BACT|nr:MAG: hypothetical protein OZSIB_2046 [Candidatus Ozemobacter sibiricus]
MKKLVGFLLVAVICFGIAVVGGLWIGHSSGASSQQEFFQAVGTNDPDKVLALMHPDLRKVIDPPILRAWQKVFNAHLGAYQGLKVDGFSTSTRQEGPIKRYETKGEAEFEKGTARAELAYVDGKIVQFSVTSPQMPAAWFTGPDGTEFYQVRGKLFLERLLRQETDLAWEMMHEELQNQVTQAEFNRQAAALAEALGAPKTVTFESERFEEPEGEQNLRLFYKIEAEKGTARGMVKYQFLGFRAHMFGYQID